MDSIQNESLTARELEVLELIAQGCETCEIASILKIEECTVRFHVENILDKLNVENRTHAVCHAIRMGWIKIDLL